MRLESAQALRELSVNKDCLCYVDRIANRGRVDVFRNHRNKKV
jgi:hypothetical protein